MVSRLWTRFSYSDCKRSGPRNDNKFSRKSSGSLEFVVSNTRIFELPSSASSNYPNQEGTMATMDEVLSIIGAQDLDTSEYQVSDLDDIEFYWETEQLDVDAVCRPGMVPPSPQQRLTIKRWEVQQKTDSARRRGRQGELSSSNNTSLRETNPTPCVDEVSPLRKNN